jgi:hypothetical protein
MLKVSLMFQEISLRKGGTMVPKEIIGADAPVHPFLSESRPEEYMDIQDAFDIGPGVLTLGLLTDRSIPGMPEAAEWFPSGGACFGADGEFFEPDQGGIFSPGLAFGDEDDEDDDDDEDNFDDMEDDFEDDFEDEDDDFEDEDDDFEDEDDDDDDYDYDDDESFDDDFEE